MIRTKKTPKSPKGPQGATTSKSSKNKLLKLKVPAKLTSAYSKHTKLKMGLTVILFLLVGWLIYSNTSLSDKVIYDSSNDKSTPKFGKSILPDPKEEDKKACNFIDLAKLNQQNDIDLKLSVARVISPKNSNTKTVICEYKDKDSGITVVKNSFPTAEIAAETYKERTTKKFKQVEGEKNTSYSKSQKQIIFKKDKNVYFINVIAKDSTYNSLEESALKIPKKYISDK